MLKEIKYLVFILIICLFIFFVSKYYFSDHNKKKSYRSFNNIDKKVELYSNKIPIIENDTINIIEWPEILKSHKIKNIKFDFSYSKNFEKRSLIISSNYSNKIIDEFK